MISDSDLHPLAVQPTRRCARWARDAKDFARKYIWWKTPDEAVLMPQRIMAQVMNIGDYEDLQSLADKAGDDVLRSVIGKAEAGQFNPRSWHYWHYRLGLSELNQVPDLPVRKFI